MIPSELEVDPIQQPELSASKYDINSTTTKKPIIPIL